MAALEARVAAWHRSVAAAEASLKAGAEASAQKIVRAAPGLLDPCPVIMPTHCMFCAGLRHCGDAGCTGACSPCFCECRG